MLARYTPYLLLALAALGAAQTVTVNYYEGVNECGPSDTPLFSMSGELGACYQGRASATANCSLLAACDGLAYPDMLDCLGADLIIGSLRVLPDGSTEVWTTEADCSGEPSTQIDPISCPIMWGALCDGRYTDYRTSDVGAASALQWM